MSQPIAFLATTRVREGRLDDYKRALRELVEFVGANEPQLIAFNAYVNEEGTEVTALQIHPVPSRSSSTCDWQLSRRAKS